MASGQTLDNRSIAQGGRDISDSRSAQNKPKAAASYDDESADVDEYNHSDNGSAFNTTSFAAKQPQSAASTKPIDIDKKTIQKYIAINSLFTESANLLGLLEPQVNEFIRVINERIIALDEDRRYQISEYIDNYVLFKNGKRREPQFPGEKSMLSWLSLSATKDKQGTQNTPDTPKVKTFNIGDKVKIKFLQNKWLSNKEEVGMVLSLENEMYTVLLYSDTNQKNITYTVPHNYLVRPIYAISTQKVAYLDTNNSKQFGIIDSIDSDNIKINTSEPGQEIKLITIPITSVTNTTICVQGEIGGLTAYRGGQLKRTKKNHKKQPRKKQTNKRSNIKQTQTRKRRSINK